MELSDAHLRYLAAIYELSRSTLDVGAAGVARAMNVSKPSVSRMLGVLMEKGLLVKERYGKIYLTDRGVLLARAFVKKADDVRARLPALGLDLSEEEQEEAACYLAALLLHRDAGHQAPPKAAGE